MKQKKHTQIQRILRLENIVAQLYVQIEAIKLTLVKNEEKTDTSIQRSLTILPRRNKRGSQDFLDRDRIVDLKTTTNIKDFSWSANKYGYDVQCYLYCNLFKKQYKDFHFLVLDKGSLDIGIFNCSEEFYYRGEEKVQKALDLYNKFFIEGADLDNYCLTGEL